LAAAMAGRTMSPSPSCGAKRRPPREQVEAISQEMDIPLQTLTGLLEQ
jgi:hypothetical protein